MQTILTKYLTKNILVVFFAIFFIIIFLIFGNAFTSVLKSSLSQNLDIPSVLLLVLIRSLKDMPIIISLSFFIAVIIAIGKSYKDSEIYAINSAGIGEIKIFKKITIPVVVATSISLFISMFLVPYSNIVKEKILQKNASASEFNFIKNQEFQSFQNGNITLYSSGGKNNSLGNIFIYSKNKNNNSIILAKDGIRYQDSLDNVYIRLKHGAKYDGFLAISDKKITDFETMDIQIFTKKTNNHELKTNSDSKFINVLLRDMNRNNISEIWWRVSLPLSLIILSAIGIFLSKTPPRGGKNFSVLYGVILFAVYLNFLKSYKDKLIVTDDLFLTMITPHLIFIVIAIALYFKNNGFKEFLNK
jgi:lipopolysaccharide export system permease protein